MKCKNILALILSMALVLSFAAIPAFAEKAAGRIVGDCKLFLPDTDAVKVTYNLVNESGEDVADNVTYTVTSTDPTWETWLDVDAATGDVYVKHTAVGKSFTVTAESDTYTASQIVTISDTVLCADFTGLTADSTLAEVTALYPWLNPQSGSKVAVNNANPYLHFYARTWDQIPSAAIVPDDLRSTHLTVEMKFITAPRAANGNVDAPTIPIIINYDKKISGCAAWNDTTAKNWPTEIRLRVSGASEGTVNMSVNKFSLNNGLPYEPSSQDAAGSYTFSGTYDEAANTFSDFTFADMKIEVYDNRNHVTINGTQTNLAFLQGIGEDVTNTNVKNISFGSAVDDLKIYTGEKVIHSFKTGLKIEGEGTVLRAPIGSYAVIPYSLAIEDESIASSVPTGVIWKVSTLKGVSVADASKGEVKVAGDAAAGTFTVTASDSLGTVLAKKDVTIVAQLTPWSCTNKSRIFCDMEENTLYYKEGTQPTSNSQYYAAYIVEGQVGLTSVSKKESNGNTYVSSQGNLAWSGLPSQGSGARIKPYDRDNHYLDKNSLFTFEGKFMAESSVINPGSLIGTKDGIDYYKYEESQWSLLFVADDLKNYGNKGVLDLRYNYLGNGLAGIYIYENGEGYNGQLEGNNWVNCDGKLIALVNIDEWFDLRVQVDYVNKVYNIYVDDVLVAKDIATGSSRYMGGGDNYYFIGAAFDDIAIYTGAKVADTQSAAESITVFKDNVAQPAGSMSFTWAEATAENEESTASAALMSGADYSGKSLITAIYNANKSLVAVKSTPVERTSAGNSIAFSKTKGSIPANGFAKVFLWDMANLKPVK